MIVMKFGGSSVESASAIERVASIVRTRLDEKPVVVVSAMGKTTNRLLEIGRRASGGGAAEARKLTSELREFHLKEAPAAAASAIDEHFEELTQWLDELLALGQFPARLVDAVSALGERLSSRIVTLAFQALGIPAEYVDSREVIITDRRHTQAVPMYTRTYQKLAERIPPVAQRCVPVMGGFIGSTQDGVTTTLGRGGSDFTAAIVGAGIQAREIEIWTDVDGILTCDPRILEDGRRIKAMSFAEAAELAFFGAKVLHPATVIPAIEKNIPVRILNSRRPQSEGTRLVTGLVPCTNIFKSIACKQGVTVVEIRSARMLMAYGFLRRIFEVFDRYRTSVDMVTTSEVSVSLTLDSPEHLEDICEDLRQIAEVTVSQDQAIICLVGDRIRDTPGIGARVFTALREVNVRMISQGASLLNLSLVVDGKDLSRAVAVLHAEFFQRLDPAVFD